MKRLGRIFENNWKLFLIVVSIVVLIVVKPWVLFRNDKIVSISERVKMAMQNFGTEEDELFGLLEPLNKIELEKVFNEFGLKNYDYGGRYWFGLKIDLFGWFAKELNKKEKAQMREIWAKTDLEITF